MQQALRTPDDLTGQLSDKFTPATTNLQRAVLDDRDHAERVETANEIWEELLDLDPNEDAPIETLSDYILQAYGDAKSARTAAGIDDKILEGRRLFEGEYTREEKAKIPGVDVWYNVVSTISNIALAFLRSVLKGDDDNPVWEITASPIPELPEIVVQRAAEFTAIKIQQESMLPDETTGQILPMTEERAIEIAEEYRTDLFEAIDRQADIHVRNLAREIKDHLNVNKFYKELDEFLQSIVVDPTACLHGPVVSSKEVPVWKDGRKVLEKRKYTKVENVDISQIFPSPDSKDAQSGSFMIYLDRMTKRDLIDAAKLKGFIGENIDIILKEYEAKGLDWLNPIYAEIEAGQDRVCTWRDYDGVDVIKFFGRVPGHILHQAKLESLEGTEIDPRDSYEMEIWICCNQIIRAISGLNPYGRPFLTASLYNTPGSFWGESIPHRARDEQRSANATLRAAIRDMGYTSGPLTQVDISMLDDSQEVPTQWTAGTSIHVNSRKRGLQGKAVHWEQLSTQAPLFMGLVDKFFLNAELNTGFNRQMMGQAQPGVATLGEANLLQGNAVTGLRSMLVPIDEVIEGFLDMLGCLIMATTDDPMLKADARFIAKGSSHLLDRELNKGNLLQFLNTVYPMSQTNPGMFEPYAMGCLVRELATSYGLDPDKFVPDPHNVEQRNIELLLRQVNAGQGQSSPLGIAGGVSQPPATQNVNAGTSGVSAPSV